MGKRIGFGEKVWTEDANLRVIRVLIIRMATGMGRITQGENTEERKEESQV